MPGSRRRLPAPPGPRAFSLRRASTRELAASRMESGPSLGGRAFDNSGLCAGVGACGVVSHVVCPWLPEYSSRAISERSLLRQCP